MEDLLAYLHFVVAPQVVDALIIGVALALVALGLTMIFGLLDVINLAHGDLYMLGGYAAFTLIGWGAGDRKSTRLNSSHMSESRMPSSA